MATPSPANVTPSGSAQQLWPGGQSGMPITIVNQDTANFWYVGYSNSIGIGATNAIALGPGNFIALDGSNTIYGVAAVGTSAVLVVPGASAYFQPATLSGLGGIKVFIQAAAPTQPPTIPVNSLWLQTSAGVVIGYNTWNGSSWVAQTFNASDVIAVGTIIANLIAAGTITTNQIAANTITANNIAANSLTSTVIGNLGAIINKNPRFSGGSKTGWNGSYTLSVTASPPANAPDTYALSMTSSTGAAGNFTENNPPAPIVAGAKYIITAWLYSTSSTGTVTIGANYYLNGAFVSAVNAAVGVSLPANTWTFVQAIATAPANVNQMGEYFSFPSNASAWTAYAQVAEVFPQKQGVVDATTITGSTITGGTINGSVFNGTNWIENASGSFYYSSTPAAGNLVASIAPSSGTDSFGNSYQAGFVVYGSSGGYAQLEDIGGIAELKMNPASATKVTQTPLIYSYATNAGLVNEFENLQLLSGQASSQLSSSIILISQPADASLSPVVQFFIGNTNVAGITTSGIVLNTGTMTINDGTNVYSVDRSITSTTVFSKTNPTTAVDITSTLTIPANNAQVGTIYKIEMPFNGVWEASGALNLQFDLNGTSTNLVPLAAGLATAGDNYGGVFRLYLQVLTTGVSGTCNIWSDGGATDTSVARAGSSSVDLFGINLAHAFNTTVSNTLAIAANFSVSNASQTIIGRGATFTRLGA